MLTKPSIETEASAQQAVRAAAFATRPLVSAHNVTVSVSDKIILENVSLGLQHSEILTVIGPNGAGKTTLARVLLGLVKPTGGTVTRQSSLRVGYVPQRFPIETIIPLTVRRFMRLNAAKSDALAMECLQETGAENLIDAQITQLSGGEFQRVLLARALARRPHLLVLDEPAQAVDVAGAAQLYALIDTIRKRYGCAVLLISHDLHIVLGASDKVVCLNRHVCCAGVPSAVAEHPEYVRLFGNEAAQSLGLYRHRHDHTHTLSGEVAKPCDHA